MNKIFSFTLIASILFTPALLAEPPSIGNDDVYACFEQESPTGGCTGLLVEYVEGVATPVDAKTAKKAVKKEIRKIKKKIKKRKSKGKNTKWQRQVLKGLKRVNKGISKCAKYQDASCNGNSSFTSTDACTFLGDSSLSERVQTRIYNGQRCERGDTGLVPVLSEGTQTCSGSVIAPNVVLTAAHCLDVIAEKTQTFSCPEISVQSGSGLTRTAKTCIVHPGWYKNPGSLGPREYDVALILLDGDLDTRLFTLEKDSNSFEAGKTVLFGGYGVPEDIVPPFDLNTAAGEITRRGDNGIHLRSSLDHPTFGHICAGDSGGPLLHFNGDQLAIIGLAHAGTMSSTCESAGLVDPISTFTDITRDDVQSFIAPYLENS